MFLKCQIKKNTQNKCISNANVKLPFRNVFEMPNKKNILNIYT